MAVRRTSLIRMNLLVRLGAGAAWSGRPYGPLGRPGAAQCSTGPAWHGPEVAGGWKLSGWRDGMDSLLCKLYPAVHAMVLKERGSVAWGTRRVGPRVQEAATASAEPGGVELARRPGTQVRCPAVCAAHAP